MTDAHTHVIRNPEHRHFLCSPTTATPGSRDRLFVGRHPWDFLTEPPTDAVALPAPPASAFGTGEIGLDRLRVRTIPAAMRSAFESQLRAAAARRHPVVLHGAKCWGEVVRTIDRVLSGPDAGRVPAFLFHGFSRAGGLLPDIVRLNGFVSVGPAVLNDHAVNYRRLVAEIPLDRLLAETDATPETASEIPLLEDIVAKIADLRGLTTDRLEALMEANADRFESSNLSESTVL